MTMFLPWAKDDWRFLPQSESDPAKSNQTRPGQTKPDLTRPDHTTPYQTRPDQTKPNQSRISSAGKIFAIFCRGNRCHHFFRPSSSFHQSTFASMGFTNWRGVWICETIYLSTFYSIRLSYMNHVENRLRKFALTLHEVYSDAIRIQYETNWRDVDLTGKKNHCATTCINLVLLLRVLALRVPVCILWLPWGHLEEGDVKPRALESS